jgi:3-hydroxyacyl-[acyl-carrier-protein] dehydratase
LHESRSVPALSRAEIEQLIPHREPALWLDEVVDISADRIHCRRTVDPTFDWFRGHYPAQPILPGVILCEACLQAGAVLIARHPDGALAAGEVPVATRLNNVKFKHMVRPGDLLDIEVVLSERLGRAFYMTGKVTVGGKTAATLDLACSAAPAP